MLLQNNFFSKVTSKNSFIFYFCHHHKWRGNCWLESAKNRDVLIFIADTLTTLESFIYRQLSILYIWNTIKFMCYYFNIKRIFSISSLYAFSRHLFTTKSCAKFEYKVKKLNLTFLWTTYIVITVCSISFYVNRKNS